MLAGGLQELLARLQVPEQRRKRMQLDWGEFDVFGGGANPAFALRGDPTCIRAPHNGVLRDVRRFNNPTRALIT